MNNKPSSNLPVLLVVLSSLVAMIVEYYLLWNYFPNQTVYINNLFDNIPCTHAGFFACVGKEFIPVLFFVNAMIASVICVIVVKKKQNAQS